MPVFKFVISHGKQSVQVEKDQKDAPVFGKKIGDTLSAEFLGLAGYELQITGGSDKDGFAMLKDVEGQMRKKQILTRGTAFRTDVKGQRKRRIVRGNAVSADISQINCKVVKAGEKSVFELLGITPKEPKAKAKKEGTETKTEDTQTEIKDEKKVVEDTQDVADVKKEEKAETKAEEMQTEVKDEKKTEAKPDAVEKKGEKEKSNDDTKDAEEAVAQE